MTPASTGDPRIPISQLDLETLLPYLDLHLAGATNGVRLFEAAGTSWEGTPYEEVFSRLSEEISEERAFLKGLIKALGHRPSLLKMAFAHAASVIARFDPLNPARRKNTGGAQLELEALQSLLKGKEALWATLLALAPSPETRAPSPISPSEDVLNRAALEDLLVTSKRQQDTVARVMTETAAARFLLT